MIGIIIIAHGGLAEAFAHALEHVVGHVAEMRYISVSSEDGPMMRQAEICAAADAVDQGEGVVFVTDLFGSTPSNLAIGACHTNRMEVLYGANLPMLIQLAKSRHLPLEQAVEEARIAGRRYIDVWRAPAVEMN